VSLESFERIYLSVAQCCLSTHIVCQVTSFNVEAQPVNKHSSGQYPSSDGADGPISDNDAGSTPTQGMVFHIGSRQNADRYRRIGRKLSINSLKIKFD